ncbi:MAG: RlmE family RNA methyltransferase [Parcubacteria group bacterium]|nr:RlmE family RNA methyltransferase [Parcubacteria group bacterium]
MIYIPLDKWALRAQKEGYVARSAYKLLDIDRRFHIFKKGDSVLDLGCSPGSFVQVAAEKIGSKGFIVGVDTEPLKVNPRTKNLRVGARFLFIKKDVYDSDLIVKIKEIATKKFDVVLSDLSPKTSGQKDIDQWKSHELALRVLDIVKTELKENGRAVIKIFEGPDTPEIIKLCKEIFKSVVLIKPEASTKGSKEAYIVAIDPVRSPTSRQTPSASYF